MVQILSPFLLIHKSGGNRNSFHLSCVFIKEVNGVKWKLKMFCKISCKIFLSKVFTQLAQLCQVAKQQGSTWSKEGYIWPGIKVHEPKAEVFPLSMLFVLCPFSSPCLHPVPEDRSRQCSPWLPALLAHAWHCWGCLPPPASSPAQPHCCFPPAAGVHWGREPHEQGLCRPWVQLSCLSGHGQKLLMCSWPCFMQSSSKGSMREPFG